MIFLEKNKLTIFKSYVNAVSIKIIMTKLNIFMISEV